MRFVDHEGKFAFQDDWHPNWEQPVRERTTYVSNSRAKDWTHVIALGDFTGHCLTWHGNVGSFMHPDLYRPVVFDVMDWDRVVESEPVKKPRRGKRYDWRWCNGRWEKDYR